MSRLIQQECAENAELADFYADICEVTAQPSPPEFFKSMGVRPDLAVATWDLVKLISTEGQLPPLVTQLMSAAISTQAGCNYCADAHGQALDTLGYDRETVERIVNGAADPSISETYRGIVEFALRAAHDPNSVTDGDVEKLRNLGVTDEEIVEIGIVVALTKFSNTWADATNLALDKPS